MALNLQAIFIMYHTYILYSAKSDRIYIGQTENMNSRLHMHNHGLVKSTQHYIPWTLIHKETFSNRSAARKREKQLKSRKGRDYIRNIMLNGRVRRRPD
jgi:putative endonuclease